MAKEIPDVIEPSYTIPQFCAAEQISTPTYYNLKKLGLAPKEMRGPLNIVRISHQARLDFQRRMEQPSEEANKRAEKARAKSRRAAKNAIKSPTHVSNTRRRRTA